WTPVYVRLQAGPGGLPAGRVSIETADSEGVGTLLSVPVPQLPEGEKHTGQAPAQPGKLSGNFYSCVSTGDATGADVALSSRAPATLAACPTHRWARNSPPCKTGHGPWRRGLWASKIPPRPGRASRPMKIPLLACLSAVSCTTLSI